VSVALGLAAAAIGSDTGGSIRVPAAWNGLVGFKPTHGNVSDAGVVPLCRRFDVAGPIARNVEDCAEIYAVLRSEKAADLGGSKARGRRLLVLDGVPFDDARPGPIAAFEDAVARLTRAGARITHAAPPCVAEAMALAPTLFAPEAYGIWQDQIEDAPELMYPPILERFRGGKQVLAADYVAGWESLNRLRADWARLVASFDAVILPTAPILPPDANRLLTEPDFFASENLLTLRNTRIANLLGLPAISLPTGHPGCGLMLMGAAGHDRALLIVAAAAETALQA
jgi:aspartyl-tRNA(Asn)/glutamyl-tRNA(Gln) amidotransferase subunit A